MGKVVVAGARIAGTKILAAILSSDEGTTGEAEIDSEESASGSDPGPAVAGGASEVALDPAVSDAERFTAADITAKSIAAAMMSSSIPSSGGGAVAGGVVATLQSLGAAGFVSEESALSSVPGAAAIGGVSAVLFAPVILKAAGFTGAGIAAKSIAASMMSYYAIANGGGVAGGGVVATLQSAGAAELGATGSAAVGSAGAAAGAVASWVRGS